MPGPRGPDRLRANVSIQLGNDGFVTLPMGTQSPLLPFNGPVHFVGVPPLTGDLAGAIRGPGVNDDDLVEQLLQPRQARGQVVLLILDDQA